MLKMYREQDYVILFLKGLNERFAHSNSQIMMMNTLPNIDKAFYLVIQQEHKMISSIPIKSTESTVTALHLNA